MSSSEQQRPGGSPAPSAATDVQTDNIEQAWAELAAFLKARGDRITATRRRVCDAVMARHDHFRADDLASGLSRDPNRVSRGTVYRTLALMVEAGLVHAFRDSDTHFHYEHTYGHSRHEHMICDVCGSFIEFDAPEVLRAIREHCDKIGFEGRTHRIAIFGACRNCTGTKPKTR